MKIFCNDCGKEIIHLTFTMQDNKQALTNTVEQGVIINSCDCQMQLAETMMEYILISQINLLQEMLVKLKTKN